MNNLNTPASPVPHSQFTGGSDGLTKREQACITLLIPESGDEELDDLIRKSRRQKLAGEVLAGFNGQLGLQTATDGAIEYADELIKQLESEE
jgi:hypothetical protein